jgi:hypothetical protein
MKRPAGLPRLVQTTISPKRNIVHYIKLSKAQNAAAAAAAQNK